MPYFYTEARQIEAGDIVKFSRGISARETVQAVQSTITGTIGEIRISVDGFHLDFAYHKLIAVWVDPEIIEAADAADLAVITRIIVDAKVAESTSAREYAYTYSASPFHYDSEWRTYESDAQRGVNYLPESQADAVWAGISAALERVDVEYPTRRQALREHVAAVLATDSEN
jgi:hypothetical protein